MLRLIVDEFNCKHEAEVGEHDQQQIYTRDPEQKKIDSFIKENFENQRSGLMYLCGHPGTGKTSSLNIVLEKLRKDGKKFHLFMFNAMTYKDVKSFMIIFC